MKGLLLSLFITLTLTSIVHAGSYCGIETSHPLVKARSCDDAKVTLGQCYQYPDSCKRCWQEGKDIVVTSSNDKTWFPMYTPAACKLPPALRLPH